MPGQQEVRWSQLKVGVLVIVALSALAALIFLMSNTTGGFWSGHLMVRSYFENSAGLKIGAPVSLEGFTVGSVTGIRIVPDRKLTPVEVTMRINKKYQYGIRQDSKTSLDHPRRPRRHRRRHRQQVRNRRPRAEQHRAPHHRNPQPPGRYSGQPGYHPAPRHHPRPGQPDCQQPQFEKRLHRPAHQRSHPL